jgi:branched-subunit amino acid aminotransferase/4-amino-4-deoxychorismate lyase
VTWTLVDGVFRPGAAVPVTDRGFRYGMSVFETFAVRAGRVLFRDEHVDRLRRACAAAEFLTPAIPAFPDLDGRTGMLRLYVTAGDGGPAQAADAGRVFALFDDAEMPGATGPGLRLTISRAPVPSVLGGWKTGNYWAHVQAWAEARRQGFDEAVVCNLQGAVMSAAMGNLFVLQGDRVLTPVLESGARDGVVRSWVAGRVPVEETQITVEDVVSAEEVFVTNSRLGVFPVAEIDGCRLPSRAAGDGLADLYREEILRQ